MNSTPHFGARGIIVHKGRLRMPRAYTLSIPLSCAYDGVTRWMDNGRMNWRKPPAWRVYLRRIAPKPPRTNRGVSPRKDSDNLCSNCQDEIPPNVGFGYIGKNLHCSECFLHKAFQ